MNKEINDSLELREPRVYEVSYLLMPTIAEDEVQNHVDAIRKIITDNGGLPIVDGEVEYIDLAYEMRVSVENVWHTFDKAYFVWMKFDATPEKIAIIDELLHAYISIIRFLLIKSDRDADVARPRLLASQKASRDTGEQENGNEESSESTDSESSTNESPQGEEAPEVSETPEVIDEDALDKHIDEMVADEESSEEDTSENNE